MELSNGLIHVGDKQLEEEEWENQKLMELLEQLVDLGL